ncbi:MAG: DUF932 domain-containing protein [Rhodospirillales bacterium]
MSNIQAADVSASVRSDFDFEVDKFPLFGPENMPTDQYGLFRSDTGFIKGVKSVSNRYVPHTTDDVCALVEAASDAFDGEIECKTHWREGHYVTVAPTKAERSSIYGTADNIFPRIVIRAGYDGQAFTGTMGYFRDACSNLAMMRRVSGTCVKIRHSAGLRPAMDELIETFGQLSAGWEHLVEVARELETREVRMVEFLDQIYGVPSQEQLQLAATGQAVRAVTSHKKRTEAIWKRLNTERQRTGRPMMTNDVVSAWEAFNAVQGYVQHDAQAKSGFKGEFDRILRAANDQAVNKAERLVLELAA